MISSYAVDRPCSDWRGDGMAGDTGSRMHDIPRIGAGYISDREASRNFLKEGFRKL